MLRAATQRDFAFLRAFSTGPDDEKLRAQIRDGRLRIIETTGEPVGFIKFYILWEVLPFIEVIMVCEDRRRRGIGRDAVRSWEREMAARSFRQTLTSTQANETAQEFWRRIGYRECGSITLPGQPAELFLFHDIGDGHA
jgi:ribosomal protein S18 acetylase RimI-like enzyme